MAALEPIPNVTKLSDRVTRILGQNPGKFTLQGTNVYLLGTSKPYILVDTAEGKDEFIPVLESALASGVSDASLPDVSDIILSHWHGDHIGGIPSVLNLLQRLWDARNPGKPFPAPRLHKHPLRAEGPSDAEKQYYTLPNVLASLPKDLYTPSASGSILHELSDSQTLTGNDITLRILHTPGHTHDSISMYIPEDRVLYTADTVLGHGTAVFEDLSLYLSSLNKMLDAHTALEYETLLPSHGPVVVNGKETIATYIKHRLEREAQVLGLLASRPPPDGSKWTTWDIVKDLYASYPENIWIPAMRGILLHLDKLVVDGKVRNVEGELQDAKWEAVKSPPSPSL
ncbi:hypothetical protein MD484_g6833, partial [Candolleomyces efflorescens]